MPRDGSVTRARLLDVGERLLATRGLYVPLLEIATEAGQRNTAAVSYHFGNRAGLISAIVERNQTRALDRRLVLIERARQDPDDPRLLAEAIVRPMAEFLSGEMGSSDYLRIVAALLSSSDSLFTEPRGILTNGRLDLVVELAAARSPELPVPLLDDRIYSMATMALYLCADRARHALLGRYSTEGDDAMFTENLVDMTLGAITATPYVPQRRLRSTASR